MCGIAGFWGGHLPNDHLEVTAAAMANAIQHRGPNARGTWCDPAARIAFGHRRLSIIDLSPTGAQPMVSPSGRYVIVYNGEVYNSAELRRQLSDVRYRGHSDTEVLLAAVDRWGVENAVRRCIGMFAFAAWDRQQHQLYLVRDRIGIKPLYYGWSRGTFLFGSELKALRAHPAFAAEIDRSVLGTYLRYNCVPAPGSIYRGVRQLRPGTVLRLASPDDQEVLPVAFWTATDALRDGVRNRFEGTEVEAAASLDSLLRDAVRIRMVANVPLGAFLSGGVDSSLVVALMQAQSAQPVCTFSIGSPDADYDEAHHARAVSRHLGTAHTELTVTATDALAVVPRLALMYDEPFGDSSQIVTYLVSALARPHVTVALSGDGGDEVFGGYNRYVWAERIARMMGSLPGLMRHGIARGLARPHPATWDTLARMSRTLIPGAHCRKCSGTKYGKRRQVLGAPSSDGCTGSCGPTGMNPRLSRACRRQVSTPRRDAGWNGHFLPYHAAGS